MAGLTYSLLGTSAVLFVVSHFLPTCGIKVESQIVPLTGIETVWWGLIGLGKRLVFGWIMAAWLANPFYVAGMACLYLGRTAPAVVVSAVALVIGVATLGARILLPERPLLVGYYVWLGSLALLALAALLRALQARKTAEGKALN